MLLSVTNSEDKMRRLGQNIVSLQKILYIYIYIYPLSEEAGKPRIPKNKGTVVSNRNEPNSPHDPSPLKKKIHMTSCSINRQCICPLRVNGASPLWINIQTDG